VCNKTHTSFQGFTLEHRQELFNLEGQYTRLFGSAKRSSAYHCELNGTLLISILCETSAIESHNSTELFLSANNYTDAGAALNIPPDSASPPKTRRKRYISQNDMIAILDYHNQVRGKVFPPASNMEYMVWDENLAKSAEAWAATCIWDHGPSYLMRFLGQNLSVRTGRYRSILQLVKPWYDEVKDYAFPYPQDCNPRCPLRCYGPVCTHYTQ
ncbi:Hypothetical predicted protein, partial [Podarcis lilfordi]